jgi:uncharacterized membrane protein required for colicin V production
VHGRRNGISVELLDVTKWLTVIVLGNLYYRPLGSWFALKAAITHNYADLLVYIGIMLTVLTAFEMLKKIVHGKMFSKKFFGDMDMRLGMIAGTVRYLCYVFVGIVILNTPIYQPHEVSVPLAKLQQQVIYNSVTGLFVRQYLPESLIEPIADTPAEKMSIAKRQEREIDEVVKR